MQQKSIIMIYQQYFYHEKFESVLASFNFYFSCIQHTNERHETFKRYFSLHLTHPLSLTKIC